MKHFVSTCESCREQARHLPGAAYIVPAEDCTCTRVAIAPLTREQALEAIREKEGAIARLRATIETVTMPGLAEELEGKIAAWREDIEDLRTDAGMPF